jgi:hypothetical protein
MGTINYGTSDYITIGYNCDMIDHNDLDNETYFINDTFDNIWCLLKQQHFYYFNITLNAGYYEGFYINIESNFIYYDNYSEKRDAQKEITQIKKFLLSCVNDFECCAVYPGWCTSYADYNETLKEIDAAIQDMRETVKSTPTWSTLPKSEKWA